MQNQVRDQALALAAVFQAALLVDRLANTGAVPNENLKALVRSLFEFDPQSTEEVFGGEQDYRFGLSLGINALKDIFIRKRRGPKYGDAVTYVIGLLHLENVLRNNKTMLDLLGTRLRAVQQQMPAEGFTDDSTLAAIASSYQETLSTLKFRIQVRGDARFLRDPEVANKVRAALLAGVRAALLWHQVGGRRWQLPFYRKRIVEALQTLA